MDNIFEFGFMLDENIEFEVKGKFKIYHNKKHEDIRKVITDRIDERNRLIFPFLHSSELGENGKVITPTHTPYNHYSLPTHYIEFDNNRYSSDEFKKDYGWFIINMLGLFFDTKIFWKGYKCVGFIPQKLDPLVVYNNKNISSILCDLFTNLLDVYEKFNDTERRCILICLEKHLEAISLDIWSHSRFFLLYSISEDIHREFILKNQKNHRISLKEKIKTVVDKFDLYKSDETDNIIQNFVNCRNDLIHNGVDLLKNNTKSYSVVEMHRWHYFNKRLLLSVLRINNSYTKTNWMLTGAFSSPWNQHASIPNKSNQQ